MAKAPVTQSTDTEGLTTGLPPEEYQTEQFKSGPDPVDKAVEAVKSEPIDIAPNQPYPTGNPPPDPFYKKPEQGDA